MTANCQTGSIVIAECYRVIPTFIRALNEKVDENTVNEKQISFFKKSYSSVYDLQFLQQNLFVIPGPFNKEHKNMLAQCKEMLEYQNRHMAIHPRFDKFISSLGTGSKLAEDNWIKKRHHMMICWMRSDYLFNSGASPRRAKKNALCSVNR